MLCIGRLTMGVSAPGPWPATSTSGTWPLHVNCPTAESHGWKPAFVSSRSRRSGRTGRSISIWMTFGMRMHDVRAVTRTGRSRGRARRARVRIGSSVVWGNGAGRSAREGSDRHHTAGGDYRSDEVPGPTTSSIPWTRSLFDTVSRPSSTRRPLRSTRCTAQPSGRPPTRKR